MTEQEYRKQFAELSKKYFSQHKKTAKFIAGESYIPATTKVLAADDLVNLVDASLDLWLTAGRFCRDLEKALTKVMAKGPPALLTNSGSSANLIATSALGAQTLEQYDLAPLKPGDEVITVAAGFPTTVNPIIQNGWVPVFVDIDKATLNALPEKIMAAKSDKTRAVIMAHTLGNPFRADLISEWCRAENLYFIEDCCDAFGSTIDSANGPQAVGSFGEFATLSFYPAHHITTGEGGAVFAKNNSWRKVAESLRDWGRDCWCGPGKDNTCGKRFNWQLGDLPAGYDHKYIYSNIGYNLKITDMQAAIGLTQLKKLPKFIEARRENYKKLNAGLSSSQLLSEFLRPVDATPNTNPSWFGFPMHCQQKINRTQLTRFLEEMRVGTRLLFAGNLAKQPAYKNANFRVVGSLDNTNYVMENTFWLGVHPALSDEMIAYQLEMLEQGVRKQL